MLSHNKKILLGLASWLAFSLFAVAEVKVGAPFPSLNSYGLEGSLPDREGKVVLIDFWATWCAPCKASFPAYSAMQKDFGERGFTIIAVSVDKTKAPYDQFLKGMAPGFATVRDSMQKFVAEIKPPGMPTCYLVDRKGLLRKIHTGFHCEADARELREFITQLLEEKL